MPKFTPLIAHGVVHLGVAYSTASTHRWVLSMDLMLLSTNSTHRFPPGKESHHCSLVTLPSGRFILDYTSHHNHTQTFSVRSISGVQAL